MILNEPETSLHGDLLPPLARLISAAAADSQNVVISHAQPLVDALRTLPGYLSITLRKELVRWPRTSPAMRLRFVGGPIVVGLRCGS